MGAPGAHTHTGTNKNPNRCQANANERVIDHLPHRGYWKLLWFWQNGNFVGIWVGSLGIIIIFFLSCKINDNLFQCISVSFIRALIHLWQTNLRSFEMRDEWIRLERKKNKRVKLHKTTRILIKYIFNVHIKSSCVYTNAFRSDCCFYMIIIYVFFILHLRCNGLIGLLNDKYTSTHLEKVWVIDNIFGRQSKECEGKGKFDYGFKSKNVFSFGYDGKIRHIR